jgi:hypothetical protein
MPADTVTLRLLGDVPLDAFAKALRAFDALVRALSREIAVDADISWIVQQLDPGSAATTVQGRSQQPQAVARVVSGYSAVGGALAADKPIPFSPLVVRPAQALRTVLNGDINTVVFETAETEALVRRIGGPEEVSSAPRFAYGAVTGRVQTLSNRGSLRFTLYDLIEDRAVSCYLVDGRQDVMRDAWGRLARVEGRITRDPLSGRPLAVRSVTDVNILEEFAPDHYLAARGASPSLSDLSAEAAVRRLRDA